MPGADREGNQHVDPQDASPLDLANHVAATVKAHARPWRAIIALAFAVVAGFASWTAAQTFKHWTSHHNVLGKLVTASTAAAFCLFAVAAVVGLAAKARDVLAPRTGLAHAAVVRYTVLLVGGLLTFVITLGLLKLPIGQLVVGGALTTILIGIAAQQSLANLFAGIVLLFSRPFAVGETVLIRSGSLNGPIEGTVTEIGLAYVRIDTGDQLLHLPNSQVLASGVGHARPAPPEPAGLEQPRTSPPGL
jgi:small-conductance mechanosensitive channel